MKKFRYFLFAVLFSFSLAGLAFSHEIATDPQTTNGTAFVTVPVYNNSASTVSKGDVVIWDIDASTGDNDLYINTTTTADTHLVAGIVYPSDIAAASAGSILIWGIVDANTESVGDIIADSAVCTGGTAGKIGSCAPIATLAATDGGRKLGHALATESSGTVKVFVGGL